MSESGKEGEESVRLFVLVPALGDTDEVDAVPNDATFDSGTDRTVRRVLLVVGIDEAIGV